MIKFLLDIKPKNTSWFVPDKEEIELRDHEKLIIEYQNKINNSKIKNKDLLKLMSDIVGFFLREQKPEWRLFFD